MKVLGIETSGGIGGFALVDDTQLVAEEVADIMGHHLERGSDMIESILTGAGLGVSDLEGIAVSLGPGSFTGLRVGLALAKGLAVGAGLALAGVPTLDAIAEGLREAEGMVVVVRDARRGEVYFAAYRAGVGGLARLGPYRALAPEAVAAELAQEGALLGSERPIVVAGDGLARYGDIFRRALGGRAAFAAEPLWHAKPGVVAAQGLRLLQAGKAADPATLEPIYVRASEAERQSAGGKRHGTDRTPKNERR